MDLSHLTSLGTVIMAWATTFLPRLLAALIILVGGYYIARWASHAARGLMTRANHDDHTMVPVVSATVRYGILIFIFIAALAQLGVATTSVLTVLGAGAIAIGLALQGTLANIAAGIMLLWLRPFRVGDYVEITSVAGTVEEINLFHSRLRTWDGIYKFVPNSLLWNTTLTNYSRNHTRLVLIPFGIAYEDDIATARKVLADFARSRPNVLADPPVQVVPLSLGNSSVVVQLRAWSTTSKFWDAVWDLTEGGKKALEGAGITLAFPQVVMHWGKDSQPPRLPDAAPPGDAAPSSDAAPPSGA